MLDQLKEESDEDTVREILTRWLESNGAEVYWGENAEEYDQETFEVNLNSIDSWGESLHRPDMLVSFDEYDMITEIKTGEKYGKIADGVWETFDYWKKHHDDNLIYETDDGNYSPDGFTFATRYSPYGHVYPSNHEFFYSNEGTYGLNDKLPQHEANMSGVTIRAMWRFAQSVVDNPEAGIGFLLSDTLESIPDFAAESDDYGMVRAAQTETIGNAAIFTWMDDQDWKTF